MEIKWLPKQLIVDDDDTLQNYARKHNYNEGVNDCEKSILENLPSEEEIQDIINDCQESIDVDSKHCRMFNLAKAIHQRLIQGKGV